VCAFILNALSDCGEFADGAPFKEFSVMEEVLVEEYGKKGNQIFKSIETLPIAAASLAQVHRAVTKEVYMYICVYV
jgi:predicted unusual protein kinase regulating ubiquinone biosynthesis (AarF/ABC1/UbiB family)